MTRFLAFTLYGPLCSWGEVAVGEERGSLGQPTKSALLGLVAAALGIERSQAEEHLALHRDLGMAVLALNPGRPLRDFQTVEVPRHKQGVSHATRREEILGLDDRDNPIISYREYRMDSIYLAALWQRETHSGYDLEQIRQALLEPRFTLYLGRKSCPPAWPLDPQLMEADTIKEAVSRAARRLFACLESIQGPGRDPRLADLVQNQRGSLHWEPDPTAPSGMDRASVLGFVRRDTRPQRGRWQFMPRDESQAGFDLDGIGEA